MRKSSLIGIVLCALVTVEFPCLAQEIVYKGKVVDKVTREPLQYVNIILKGRPIGTFSDEAGSFKIECNLKDSLMLSHIGYNKLTIPVEVSQELVELTPQSSVLNEVVVTSSRKTKKETLGFFDQKGDIFMGGIFQHALYLENKSQRTGFIRTLYFKLGHAVNREKADMRPGKIRVRIFEREPSTGAPGRDLLRKELIFEIKPNQSHIKVDLSKENIPFLPTGVFIGLDILGYVDESGALVNYHINDAKKHLHIPVTTKLTVPLTYTNPDGQEWRIHKRLNAKTGRREITNACFGAEVEF